MKMSSKLAFWRRNTSKNVTRNTLVQLDTGETIDVRHIDPDKITEQLGKCPMTLVFFIIATNLGWMLFAFQSVKMALIMIPPQFACTAKVCS